MGGTTYLFSTLTGRPELSIGYWHIPTMTTIGSLLVLALGAVLLRFSLESKVLASWFWHSSSSSPAYLCRRSSIVGCWRRRLGIAGVVALWLVVWLLWVRRQGFLVPVVVGPTTATPAAPAAETTDKQGSDSNAQ